MKSFPSSIVHAFYTQFVLVGWHRLVWRHRAPSSLSSSSTHSWFSNLSLVTFVWQLLHQTHVSLITLITIITLINYSTWLWSIFRDKSDGGGHVWPGPEPGDGQDQEVHRGWQHKHKPQSQVIMISSGFILIALYHN